MQQRLEPVPECRVREGALPQLCPVELAVGADEPGAEGIDDGEVAGFACATDRMRDVVGVEDIGAAGGERRGDPRFAAADAAGETDDERTRHRNQPRTRAGPKNSAMPPAMAR